MLLVFALVVVFAVRYRRGSSCRTGTAAGNRQPRIRDRLDLRLPCFCSSFCSGGPPRPMSEVLSAPANALEMHVVAKQWMWKTQHSNGAREINALHVPVERPVRLVMTSQDVIHSFFVPAFRIKQDVLPGRDTEIWFRATKTGVFPLLCAEYCGTDHSMMRGRIVVMRQEDYSDWLSRQPEGDDLAHEGAKLFVAQGCSGCHAESSSVHARNWPACTAGPCSSRMGAKSRPMTVISAIQYCSRSATSWPAIEPIMPSFAGLLDDGEIQSLTAYIRSQASGRAGEAEMTDALLAGDLPLPPRPDYLRHGTTLTSWLTTTDHKRIAILYAITITIFFFMGGVAITLVRLELFTPNGGLLTSDTYNKLFSFHGIVMVGSSWCRRSRTRWAISCYR